MNDSAKLALIGAGAAVVVIGALYLLARKAGAAVVAVGQAVNPVSDKNIAYQGVNAAGAAVTGDSEFSLGTWLYNVTHADEAKGLLGGALDGAKAP